MPENDETNYIPGASQLWIETYEHSYGWKSRILILPKSVIFHWKIQINTNEEYIVFPRRPKLWKLILSHQLNFKLILKFEHGFEPRVKYLEKVS